MKIFFLRSQGLPQVPTAIFEVFEIPLFVLTNFPGMNGFALWCQLLMGLHCYRGLPSFYIIVSLDVKHGNIDSIIFLNQFSICTFEMFLSSFTLDNRGLSSESLSVCALKTSVAGVAVQTSAERSNPKCRFAFALSKQL